MAGGLFPTSVYDTIQSWLGCSIDTYFSGNIYSPVQINAMAVQIMLWPRVNKAAIYISIVLYFEISSIRKSSLHCELPSDNF